MKEKENDKTIAEKCLLAIMLYNDDMRFSDYKYIFNHLPLKMFFNNECKAIYKIIEDTYQNVEKGILGTDLYRFKVQEIFDLLTEFKNVFAITDLEEYWYSKTMYKHWLSVIQRTFFSEAYKSAESREEFQDIADEEDNLTVDSEMEYAYKDAEIILDNYEKNEGTSVDTPWASINKLIGSFQGGDMIVLAGSTGGGKTCTELNLALYLAKSGKPVDIFSLEMPKQQLVQRIVCSELGIDASKFRTFSLTDDEIKRIREYVNGEFKKLPINIFNRQRVSIDEIERIEKHSKSSVVFIDYLGLVEGDKRLGRYDRFSEISRNIKLLAMTTNKPVVALHQLSREFMQRDTKEPQLSDLRDSGQIEQDADMVLFVYRPGLFDGKTDKSVMKFIVAKNRHGEQGKKDMFFNGNTQKIEESRMAMTVAKVVEEMKERSSAKVYTIGKTRN